MLTQSPSLMPPPSPSSMPPLSSMPLLVPRRHHRPCHRSFNATAIAHTYRCHRLSHRLSHRSCHRLCRWSCHRHRSCHRPPSIMSSSVAIAVAFDHAIARAIACAIAHTTAIAYAHRCHRSYHYSCYRSYHRHRSCHSLFRHRFVAVPSSFHPPFQRSYHRCYRSYHSHRSIVVPSSFHRRSIPRSSAHTIAAIVHTTAIVHATGIAYAHRCHRCHGSYHRHR